MADSKIEWTDKTWNPVTGCTKVSQGCKHCYAETIADRLWAQQYPPNADGSPRKFTDVRLHPDRLEQPFSWRKPARVFVNSMSDLFHDDVPSDFILRVWITMAQTPQHVYQILTKRPERMASFVSEWLPSAWALATLSAPLTKPLPNVWLGVSVEDQATAKQRIPFLYQLPAAVRFLSCEPLLGRLDLGFALAYVDWVIVGGESGAGARGFDTAWADRLIKQCRAAGVACFVKQLGALPYHTQPDGKTAGAKIVLRLRDRKGGNMEEWPEGLRIRQWPEPALA